MRRKRKNLRDKTSGEMLPNVAAKEGKTRRRNRARSAAPARTGEQLDVDTRAAMERLLNARLEDVRVHDDAEAHASAADLEARAYTRGRQIYFAQGEYDPGSAVGRELLAHELAHAVQNAGTSGARTVSSKPELEAEARLAATRLREGGSLQVSGGATSGEVLHAEETEETLPTLTLHGHEITPAQTRGQIAVGALVVKFRYVMGGEGAQAKLLLELPEGMQANVVPLGASRELKIADSGGDSARVIEITAPTGTGDVPRVRATFTEGGASHVVLFQFPA